MAARRKTAEQVALMRRAGRVVALMHEAVRAAAAGLAASPLTTMEKAASPCQPSITAPQSIDSRSPSSRTEALGTPWRTVSLTLEHSTAG